MNPLSDSTRAVAVFWLMGMILIISPADAHAQSVAERKQRAEVCKIEPLSGPPFSDTVRHWYCVGAKRFTSMLGHSGYEHTGGNT